VEQTSGRCLKQKVMKQKNYLEKVSTFYSTNKEGIYNDYLDSETHKRKDIPYELFVIAICDSGKKPYANDMYNWVGENYELLKDRWKDHQEKYDLFEFMLEIYKEVV
jgi:hypothetical protein